jgi:hypothetical protein
MIDEKSDLAERGLLELAPKSVRPPMSFDSTHLVSILLS